MFEKRKKELKYYSLEELKVGMRVSVLSLSKIYQEAIYLDRNTYKDNLDEIGKGTIVAIGMDDAKARRLKANEVVIVSNPYDMTDETITEDPIEYDWDEWVKMQE